MVSDQIVQPYQCGRPASAISYRQAGRIAFTQHQPCIFTLLTNPSTYGQNMGDTWSKWFLTTSDHGQTPWSDTFDQGGQTLVKTWSMSKSGMVKRGQTLVKIWSKLVKAWSDEGVVRITTIPWPLPAREGNSDSGLFSLLPAPCFFLPATFPELLRPLFGPGFSPALDADLVVQLLLLVAPIRGQKFLREAVVY